MGYPGWLWTYGIDVSQTTEDIRTIYAGGPEAAQLMSRYGVRYVEVGPEEYFQYVVGTNFFSQFPIVVRSSDRVLYQIQ